eukprot:TRINITY_DN12888_c0_g2_i4.p1 TRINITY_DN12888_c0_g2~~TRINITY_DN12888_c0_g2_i4.p1  ORF type:complete len:307 (+),score=55.29 TRINITY_DN12888_c0_g2_i4:239-1159(+)
MTSGKREVGGPRREAGKTRRCMWTSREDEVLLRMATEGNNSDWTRIAEALHALKTCHGLQRTPKQCRERWHNRVDPAIKTSPWTEDETDRFFELFRTHGPKWSLIALQLTGRTDNTVKNFFYCKLRKIARRIKKNIITEEMKHTTKEIEYNTFLIRYLQAHFSGDRNCPINDKYISEMAEASNIGLEKINNYLKTYQSSKKFNSPANDTEDSLTKSNVFVFPNSNPQEKQKKDCDSQKRNKSFSNTDIMFFAQLLFMENNLQFDTNPIELPVPGAFEGHILLADDGFRPNFSFGQAPWKDEQTNNL